MATTDNTKAILNFVRNNKGMAGKLASLLMNAKTKEDLSKALGKM
jgi:hypothetical protein